MDHHKIQRGSENVSIVCKAILESGLPVSDLDTATPGLSLSYRLEGSDNVNIALNDLANLSAAHNDGGIEFIGNGYFRLDLPDAALATTNSVLVHGAATGAIIIAPQISLVSYNPVTGATDSVTPVQEIAQGSTEPISFHLQKADGTPATGLAGTCVVTIRNGATTSFAAIENSTITEVGNGDYLFTPSNTTETNIAGWGALHATDPSLPVNKAWLSHLHIVDKVDINDIESASSASLSANGVTSFVSDFNSDLLEEIPGSPGVNRLKESALEAANVTDVLDRIPAALVNGRIDSNVGALNGNSGAANRFALITDSIISGLTTNTILSTTQVSTNLNPTVVNQYRNRLLTFKGGPVQDQQRQVLASDINGVLTFSSADPFSAVPVEDIQFTL